MSACRFCGRSLSDRVARACERCGDVLHADCWDQIAGRQITGCGHDQYIACLAFLDERTLLATDNTGAVRLWDLETRLDRVVARMRYAPSRIFVTQDGSALVAVLGSSVFLYDLADWNLRREVSGPSEGMATVALDASGTRLVSSSGRRLHLIDLAAGTVTELGEELVENVNRLDISPDGSRVAAFLQDGTLVLRDADLGVDLVSSDVSEVSRYANSLLFTRDGADVVVDTGQELVAFDGMTGQLRWRERLGVGVQGIYERSDGAFLIVGGGPYQEVLAHVVDRAKTPAVQGPRSYNGLLAYVVAVAYLDGEVWAASGGDGHILVVVRDRTIVLEGHRAAFFASPEQESRKLWSIETGFNNPQLVRSVDDTFAVGGSLDSGFGIELVEQSLGRVLNTRRLSEYASGIVVLNVAGRREFALPLGDGMLLSRWSDGGQLWRMRNENYADRSSVELLEEGGKRLLVASAAWQTRVEGIDHETGEVLWTTERRELQTLPAPNLVRRPDGSLLLLAREYRESKTFLLGYRVGIDGTLSEVAAAAPDTGFGPDLVVLTPDGVHACVGPLYPPNDSGAMVALFDLEEFVFLRPVTGVHRLGLRQLAISPIGYLLVTLGQDHMIRLWDLRTSLPLAAFGPSARVPGNAWISQDGSTMLVGEDSGSAEAWDLRGIDQRTDVFAALCALRWEKPGAKRAAEVLLRPRERDEETLAALLLYEELFGAVPAWAEEALEGERLERSRAALSQDFDRRVRRALAARTE